MTSLWFAPFERFAVRGCVGTTSLGVTRLVARGGLTSGVGLLRVLAQKKVTQFKVLLRGPRIV